MNEKSLKSHVVEGPITYDFTPHSRVCDHTKYLIWEVCWDDNLWTVSFGLPQCHGHGSWLVYESGP